ncbi:phage tail tape measure protein [Marinifilum flexuosum]|uniref:TP901 family phage tail tape measure protein n=1 Tax=Marinifilum flexuosum TaxID=1117708 RepID=A0A419WMV3_9BACT|nr:phage tail tape measure protein [Marinifilum flexuosum]RKD96787.1 TP901 family phage tail tape measure protein [Marinifilum flexuosum]
MNGKKTIASLTVKIAANAAAFMSGIEKAQKKMQRFSRKMERTGKSMARNYTVPMAAIAAAGVMMANSLDVSFSKIENLVGIGGKALTELKHEVKAISSETGLMQQEMSEASFVVTSAGLRGAHAMNVVKMAAKAANIGLGETKEIARAVTAVMQAYGPEMMSAAHATDTLTAIVREGNLEASDLAPTLGRVVGMAAQLGISFEEVGANIATFTRLGVGAEEAVVGLRGVMSALIKPTAESKEALKSIGMTFAQLRDRVQKGGLANALRVLMEKFRGNDEGLSKLIPNVRALANVLGTAGAQAENYSQIVTNLNNANGIVDEGFKNVSKTADFKFRTALVNLKTAGIELGKTLMPIATQLADIVSGAAKWVANLDETTRKWIVGIGLAVAAIGPLLIVVGKSVSVIASLAGAIKGFMAVGGAMSAIITPIPALLLGVAAAIGAVVIAQKQWGKQSASEKLKSERTELNLLVKSLITANDNESARATIIKEINEKYPAFLKGIDTEKVGLDEIKKRLILVNDQYKDRIRLMIIQEDAAAKESELNSLYRKQADHIKTITESFTHMRKNAKVDGYLSDLGRQAETFEEIIRALKQSSSEGDPIYMMAEKAEKKQAELNQEIQKTESAYEGLLNKRLHMETLIADKIKEQGDLLNEQTKIVQNQSSSSSFEKDRNYLQGNEVTSGVTGSGNRFALDLSGMKAQMEWVKKTRDELLNITVEINQAFQSMVMGIVDAFSTSLEAIGAGTGNLSDLFNNILISVADFCISFGKSLIAAGVAAIAFKSLLANPWAAVAAGAALVAAASVVKGILSAGPGGDTSGGNTMSIQAGPVAPAYAGNAASGYPDRIELYAKGDALKGVIDQTNKRIGYTRS